jgi:hypothetical protein
MRKGFIVTLATVAIALMGFQAMATAPTIGDIPDVIVGDEEDGTPSNRFVYPDAIDLDAWVSDEDSTPGAIIWSYSVSTVPTRYTLNAVAPESVDHVNPTNRIDDTDDDPAEADSNPRTITIRDELRSPVASDPGPYLPDPPAGGPGVLPDNRMVTLHASDGSTVSQEGGSFIIYTEDDGPDGFSPRDPGMLEFQYDLTSGVPSGWVFAQDAGTVTESSTGGLCLQVGSDSGHDGNWHSPYGEVELAQNSVWQTRVTVTTDQTTLGANPMWMIVYDNINDAGTSGQNEYGGQCFFWDNEGSKISPISGTGRSDFYYWMAPTAQQVSYFASASDGFFSSTLDPNNDMRIILRIFDTAPGTIDDTGTLCFTSIEVKRYDLDDMQVESTLMDESNLTDTGTGTNRFGLDVLGASASLTASGGNLNIGPGSSGAWDNANTVVLLRPGDSTVDFTGGGAPNADNWPIQFEADSTYYIEYQLSSPSAAEESDSPDVIRVGADMLTAELVLDHFLVPNTPDLSSGFNTRGLSMPRTGGPYPYFCLFQAHDVSATSIPDGADRMRPRFEVLNAASLAPIGRTTNSGSINVHSVKVQKVTFSQ